jgi:peptide/nickel transport system permease protein
MSFPAFYLMLALRAVFPLSMSSITVYIMIIVILSFLGWPGLARVIRGMTLSLKEREYILATKSLGGSTPRILVKHLLPQTISYTIVAASLSIPGYILGESALSLLGLGIMEPFASWGNMLSRAMSITDIQFHPWILWPGFFIFITVMAFNFLGDGLRDILDPRAVITGKGIK